MKIENIMSTNIISIEKGTTIKEAANIMKKHDIGFLPILDNKDVIGVITDRDIVIKCLTNNAKLTTTVCKYKNDKVVVINKSETPEYAMYVMGINKVTRLLVLDDTSALKGVVSLFDIYEHANDLICNSEIRKIKNTEKTYNVNSSVSDFEL